ncbi:MAG: hypothetical protein OYH76_01620 [Defluviicoccus sp.]|nr:hypothetical protein [Defluviicoccus sp.]MDE0274563.1 hypothetical protein [Defluviicoccus sp.]
MTRADGLQPGLAEPVAILPNEPAEMLSPASAAGFRCFADAAEFRRHVETGILNPETG